MTQEKAWKDTKSDTKIFALVKVDFTQEIGIIGNSKTNMDYIKVSSQLCHGVCKIFVIGGCIIMDFEKRNACQYKD